MTTKEAKNLFQRHRFDANLTQIELADQLGVTHSYVSRGENGHVFPSEGYIKSFCGVLKLDYGRMTLEANRTQPTAHLEQIKQLLDDYGPMINSGGLELVEGNLRFVIEHYMDNVDARSIDAKHSITNAPNHPQWEFWLRYLTLYIQRQCHWLSWDRLNIYRSMRLNIKGEPLWSSELYATGLADKSSTPVMNFILETVGKEGGIYDAVTFGQMRKDNPTADWNTGKDTMVIPLLTLPGRQCFVTFTGDNYTAKEYRRCQGVLERYIQIVLEEED